jgi:outer membrane immunogenic protein
MRLLALLDSVAIVMAGSAYGADLPSRAPPPVYVPPAPIFAWTGFYVGGQVGYAWGRQVVDFGDQFGFADSLNYNANGVIGGAHVGYNLKFSQFVGGLEGDVDGSSLSKSVTVAPAAIGFDPLTFNAHLNVQGSIRGRIGYAWDRVLLYGTGGVAFAGATSTLATPTTFDRFSTSRVGWTVGAGLAPPLDL